MIKKNLLFLTLLTSFAAPVLTSWLPVTISSKKQEKDFLYASLDATVKFDDFRQSKNLQAADDIFQKLRSDVERRQKELESQEKSLGFDIGLKGFNVDYSIGINVAPLVGWSLVAYGLTKSYTYFTRPS